MPAFGRALSEGAREHQATFVLERGNRLGSPDGRENPVIAGGTMTPDESSRN
jgi:hypothetical protein